MPASAGVAEVGVDLAGDVALQAADDLERLATALRSLNARLRVHGLTDEEAALLPTRIDKETLGRMEISTWRTDAGDFDVLTDCRAGTGTACATTS